MGQTANLDPGICVARRKGFAGKAVCVVLAAGREALKILVFEIPGARAAGFGAVELVVVLAVFLEFVFIEFFSGRGDLRRRRD